MSATLDTTSSPLKGSSFKGLPRIIPVKQSGGAPMGRSRNGDAMGGKYPKEVVG